MADDPRAQASSNDVPDAPAEQPPTSAVGTRAAPLSKPGNHAATEDRLRAWWPHRPLLTLGARGGLLTEVSLLTRGHNGGEVGAQSVAYFHDGQFDYTRDSYDNLLEHGGVSLTATFIDCASAGSESGATLWALGLPVTVRVTQPNADSRATWLAQWTQPVSQGCVRWSMVGDARHYDDADIAALVSSVTEW